MTHLNILVVDDHSFSRKVVIKVLQPIEVKITEAADGCEALEKLRDGKTYDLVITDVEMPRVDGHTLCKTIKSSSKLKKTPVVMISNFDSDASIEQGFDSGADAFVTKGKLIKQLRGVVTSILTKAKYLDKKEILIVDDSPLILGMLKKNLSEAGFQVTCAKNGLDALNKMRLKSFDLILSDLKMPQMDGFELCEQIKSDPELSDIPIIVMSASKEKHTVKQLMHHGIAGFMVKPFHPDELHILIERIFSDQFQHLLKEKKSLVLEKEMLLGSITSLASALEARDKYTKGHSESVADIVCGMAQLKGFDQDNLKLLRTGALLHDIGKIGIRDAVLLKEGKLTDEEFDHIKTHTRVGTAILQSIPSFEGFIPLVLHHHERFDGCGYPGKLQGKDIPLWARMTSVADTYDAMTSDRPYRKGMPHEKAVSIIKEVSGTQLCPESVDLFLLWADK